MKPKIIEKIINSTLIDDPMAILLYLLMYGLGRRQSKVGWVCWISPAHFAMRMKIDADSILALWKKLEEIGYITELNEPNSQFIYLVEGPLVEYYPTKVPV